MTTILLAGAGEVGSPSRAATGRNAGPHPIARDRSRPRPSDALAAALGNIAQRGVRSTVVDASTRRRWSPRRCRRPRTCASPRPPSEPVSRWPPPATRTPGSRRSSRWTRRRAGRRRGGRRLWARSRVSSEVLARHAADALDVADEVHVRPGRHGRARMRRRLRRVRRERALEWHDGDVAFRAAPGSATRLVSRSGGCSRVRTAGAGVTLMRDAVPGSPCALPCGWVSPGAATVARGPERRPRRQRLGRRPGGGLGIPWRTHASRSSTA